eukprot:203696_1
MTSIEDLKSQDRPFTKQQIPKAILGLHKKCLKNYCINFVKNPRILAEDCRIRPAHKPSDLATLVDLKKVSKQFPHSVDEYWEVVSCHWPTQWRAFIGTLESWQTKLPTSTQDGSVLFSAADVTEALKMVRYRTKCRRKVQMAARWARNKGAGEKFSDRKRKRKEKTETSSDSATLKKPRLAPVPSNEHPAASEETCSSDVAAFCESDLGSARNSSAVTSADSGADADTSSPATSGSEFGPSSEDSD